MFCISSLRWILAHWRMASSSPAKWAAFWSICIHHVEQFLLNILNNLLLSFLYIVLNNLCSEFWRNGYPEQFLPIVLHNFCSTFEKVLISIWIGFAYLFEQFLLSILSSFYSWLQQCSHSFLSSFAHSFQQYFLNTLSNFWLTC